MSDSTEISVAGRHLDVARSLGEIDLDNLTREVQDANGTSIWWGVMQAEADHAVERAKLQLDVVKAEAAQKYRLDRNLGAEKTTEPMVAEHLTLHKGVREAKENVFEAERKAAILRAVSMSVNQKARTLEKLTFLIGQEHGANRSPLRDEVKRRLREEQEEPPRARRQPV